MKADNVTALNALKLAMQDIAKQTELEHMEKKKSSEEGMEHVEQQWEIDDGTATS